jgi:hypothetical protein
LRASTSVSGPKHSPTSCEHDLLDDGLVGPGVEVVDELGALVAEVASVLEAGRTFHDVPTLLAGEDMRCEDQEPDDPHRDHRHTRRMLATRSAQLGRRARRGANGRRATDLPGWTVQDNLSHLIGIERTLQGLPATDHRVAKPDHVRNAIGEMNEHEVDSRRGLPAGPPCRRVGRTGELRLATLRAGDEAYFAVPR